MLYLAYTSETVTIEGEDTYAVNSVIGIFSTVENARAAVAAYYRERSATMSKTFDCDLAYVVGSWDTHCGLVGDDSYCAMVDSIYDGRLTEYECEMVDIIPIGEVDSPTAPVDVLNIY